MKKVHLIVLVGMGLAVAAGLLVWSFSEAPTPGESKETEKRNRLIADVGKRDAKAEVVKPAKTSARKTLKRISKRASKKAAKAAKSKVRKAVRVAVDDLSPADRILVDALQAATDGEDAVQIRAAALSAMKSGNPEVRQQAIEALGSLGEKALSELTSALSDADEDVAAAARSVIEDTLMGMDDEMSAFTIAGEYLRAYDGDEEARTMFSGVYESTAIQVVEPGDCDSAEEVARARKNRQAVADSLDAMIKSGGKVAAEARELYETLSGEEWTNREAAEKWINDLEEPELPEADDEGNPA